MYDHGFWTMHRAAGFFLVLSFVAMAIGALTFVSRGGSQGGTAPILERGAIMVAVVFTAIGLMLLDVSFQNSDGRILARLGVTVYLFAGPLLLVAEGLALSQGEKRVYALIVIYVVLAFLAQAAIGGALLQSRMLPAWIGWITVAWNLGWLVVLPIITPDDVYYPVLHNLLPLVIGIPLLWRG